MTGQMCTWIIDEATAGSGSSAGSSVGHIGCAPDGTIAVGSDCVRNAPGPMGYDNCAPGGYCFGPDTGGSGVCKQICDQNGGTPMCATTGPGSSTLGFACATYDGIFGPAGMAVAAGVCDPACDGLADNDFLTGGSAKSGMGYSTSTGTICTAQEGCYGFPNNSGSGTTQFTCSIECAGAGSDCSETSYSTLTLANAYLNACSQGYIPLLYSDSAHDMVACIAYCAPADCYQGSCGSGTTGDGLLDGAVASGSSVGPHQCDSSDARGKFNPSTLGSAGTNDMRCEYSWEYEVGSDGTVYTSKTSDLIGLCTANATTPEGGLGCSWDPSGGSDYDTECEKCDLVPLTGSGNVVPCGSGGSNGQVCYSGSAGDWACIKSAELGSGSGTGAGIKRLEHPIHKEMGRPMYHMTRAHQF
jgi:hypothetical protein